MTLHGKVRNIRFVNLLRPWPYVAAVGLFLGYSLWIGWPYMHSVVVRDAAVTSWSNVATAPIGGTIQFSLQGINEGVGEDGLIASIRNDHVSTEAVDAALLRLNVARAGWNDAQGLLEDIKVLDDERRQRKAQYAELFRNQLDTEIAHYEAELAVSEIRLDTIRTISERKNQLAHNGVSPVNIADETFLRVGEVELELEDLRAALRLARKRRSAADRSVFVDASGDDPGWVHGTRVALKLEKKRARFELRAADAELASAEAALASARADLKRQSVAEITAPKGQILWRRHTATGMTVSAGETIAELIDCNRLLVDMPVSDAEASLIMPGEPASVVLEGEARSRSAKVILVRGSASTLGREELAAIAKGRRPDDAEVLLRLDASAADFESCPVGRAAYVDFPGIGIVDVIMARLRLQ